MNISDRSIHPVYRIDFYPIQFQHLNFNTIWQTIFSWYGTTPHKHSAVSTRFHMHPFYRQDIIFELSATSYYPDGQTFTDEDAIPEFPSIFFSIHLMPFYFFHLHHLSISETLIKRNNRNKFKYIIFLSCSLIYPNNTQIKNQQEETFHKINFLHPLSFP